MISKNKIKLIRSLEQRKFRRELKLFVAEGHKLVDDLLPGMDGAARRRVAKTGRKRMRNA